MYNGANSTKAPTGLNQQCGPQQRHHQPEGNFKFFATALLPGVPCVGVGVGVVRVGPTPCVPYCKRSRTLHILPTGS